MENKTDPRVNDTQRGDEIVRSSMKCTGICKTELPLDMFHPSDVKSGRKSSRCKECKKRIYHERDYNTRGVERKRNDPNRKSKDRARYKKRRDKILARLREPKNSLKRKLKKYGLTESEYEELKARSKGLCESGCKRPATDIDHCHRTGKVRGLLCNSCNRALGFLLDNSFIISGLLTYINTRSKG
jgi:Recombination endonuclease VII